MQYQRYGASKQYIDNVEIICYGKNINVHKKLCICVLVWYHLYLNKPGGGRLTNKIQQVRYWKVLVTKTYMYVKPRKICHQFRKRKRRYVHLTPKIIAELKPRNLVHTYLIGKYYNKPIRHYHPDNSIPQKYVICTCMMMLDPAKVWFEIFEIPCFDLDEVAVRNEEYIDTNYTRVNC